MRDAIQTFLDRIPQWVFTVMAYVTLALICTGLFYMAFAENAMPLFAFGMTTTRVALAGALYFLIDRFIIHTRVDTPYELSKGNVAVGVFSGAVFIGICLLLQP